MRRLIRFAATGIVVIPAFHVNAGTTPLQLNTTWLDANSTLSEGVV